MREELKHEAALGPSVPVPLYAVGVTTMHYGKA